MFVCLLVCVEGVGVSFLPAETVFLAVIAPATPKCAWAETGSVARESSTAAALPFQ